MVTDSERQALAAFCAALPRLRRILRGPLSHARRAAVEQAVLAARRGDVPGELLARLGVDGADGPVVGSQPRWAVRGTRPTPVADAGPKRVTGVYVCPQGICPRAEERGASTELPVCGIHDQALRFVADR